MGLFKPKVDRDEVNPDEPQSPAMAVLDTVQPLQVEGGEGKIHEMQARHARVAMTQAIAEAKQHLAAAADPRPVVKRYPMAAVGGAAVVGFLGTYLAIPSDKQKAADRLLAIEKALRAESAWGGRGQAGGSPSLGKRIVNIGLRYAKPTLLSFVTSALTGAAGGAAVADNDASGPVGPPPPAPPAV